MRLKLLFVFLIFLPLVGCSRTLADEAHDQAQDAFESGEFLRGSLLLAAGCPILHSQSVYLLRMIHYQSSREIFQSMAAWSSIRALDARYDFVQDAAGELMREFAREMASEPGNKMDHLHAKN